MESPSTGRILDADGNVVNLVDAFGAGAKPVSDQVYNPDEYRPASGSVIGEDGRVYSILDLIGATAARFAEASIPQVYIEGDYLTDWTGKADERKARLSYRSTKFNFEASVMMKPQGSSSLEYPKKNFTVKLYQDDTFKKKKGIALRSAWGEQSKYVLKADYIDPTHACNVVSARLAAQMQAKYSIFPEAPNNGLIDGFPVLVHFNGVCQGLYNWTIPKDGWMFGFSGDDEDTALVLSCETQTGSGAFLADAEFSDTSWSVEYGSDDENALAVFNRLIAFVRDSTDTTFRERFGEYLNLDATLNYYCFAYLACGVDSLGKNMLMVTRDRQAWYPSLYDLDSLWGISFDGTTLLNYDHPCPEWYQCSASELWAKMERCFPDELAARYAELRESVLSTTNILTAFEKYVYSIPERLYAEDRAIWPGLSAMARTLDTMRSFVPQRAQYVDFQFRNLHKTPSGEYGTLLYALTSTFIGNGANAYIDTGFRPFDNPDKDWTLLIKLPNTNITEGYRIIAAAYDGDSNSGLLIKREYTDNNETFVLVGNGMVARTPTSASAYSAIAIVKNRHHYRVYRDGALCADIDYSALPAKSMIPLRIGCSGNAYEAWQFSFCVVENLRVYQRALGDADVLALMALMA